MNDVTINLDDATNINGFSIESRGDFPPGSNPYHHNLTLMGQRVGTDLHVLYGKHDSNPFVLLYHVPSGKILRVGMPGETCNID